MRRVIRSDVEGRRNRQRERRYQEKYARRHGYYWLPCVICGEEHGGHEGGGSLPVEGDENRSHTICPRCTAERQEAAEGQLRELGRSYVHQTSRWGSPGVMYHRVGERPSGERRDAFEFVVRPPA